MKRRFLSALLALLCLLPAMTACSESSSDNPDTAPPSGEQTSGDPTTGDPTTPTDTDTPEQSELEQRASVPDDLPDVTFDGRTLRMLTTDAYDMYGYDYATELLVEDSTGESCNDAIYDRAIKVGERFDVGFSVEKSTTPYTNIVQMAQTSTPDFDLVGMYEFVVSKAILANAGLNWLTVPHVDLSKPWHNQLANDASTINGRLYAICSDLAITTMLYTHAFFFNSALTEKYNYSPNDIYNMVLENEWTIDKAMEITSDMYDDTNGNGEQDEDDQYGFSYSVWNAADVWLAAFDKKVCDVSDTGIELTFMDDKTVAIVEKLYDWHYNRPFFNYKEIYKEEIKMAEGKLVFAPIRFKACFDANLRTMEDEYCIIPYPKWDTAQAQYLTNADDKFTMFMLPTTAVNDLDFIGTIYEALCAESYKTVYPTYYDEALKGRYSSDPTTAEMIDLIMAGRNFDFAFQFAEDAFSNLPYMVRNCLQSKTTDVASEYASMSKALVKKMERNLYPAYGLE